jgi:hypothetical protein
VCLVGTFRPSFQGWRRGTVLCTSLSWSFYVLGMLQLPFCARLVVNLGLLFLGSLFLLFSCDYKFTMQLLVFVFWSIFWVLFAPHEGAGRMFERGNICPLFFSVQWVYPPITYYWSGLLILDRSYIVGNLTNSEIAETKALEPLKSWHFCISNFRTWWFPNELWVVQD